MIENVEQAKERLKEIVDFYKLNDENNYDYSDDVLISMKLVLEENKRLNNIINELEKWLNEKICLNKNDKDYINGMTFVGVNLQMYQMFLDKLQELKGSGK